MIRQLSLKVLLSLFAFIFSASVGLSAVYECKFGDGKSGGWGGYRITNTTIKLDTKSNNAQILSGLYFKSDAALAPYKVTASNSGLTFNWNFWTIVHGLNNNSQYLQFKLDLESRESVTKARLSLLTDREWTNHEIHGVKSTGECKLLQSDVVAAVATPSEAETTKQDIQMHRGAIYKCRFYIRESKSYTGGLFTINTQKSSVLISGSNSFIFKESKGPHKIEMNEKMTKFNWSFGGFVPGAWGNAPRYANLKFELRLSSKNDPIEATILVKEATWNGWSKQNGNCILTNSDVITAASTPTTEDTTELSKPDALEAGFAFQKPFDRRNIQMVLSDLGLYKSTIDGFYGSGTESALKTYNEEYFSGLDLTQEANVNALFKAILTPRVVEVDDAGPALDTLLSQIDDIVGGELEPSKVDQLAYNAQNDELTDNENLKRRELIAEVQELLNNAGCEAGFPDGVWGKKSKAAALTFASISNLPSDEAIQISKTFINKLRNAPQNVCAKVLDNFDTSTSSPSLVGSWELIENCDGVKDGEGGQGMLKFTSLISSLARPKLDDYKIILDTEDMGIIKGTATHDRSNNNISLVFNLNPTVRQNLKLIQRDEMSGTSAGCRISANRL